MPKTFLEGLENGLGSLTEMKKRHRDEKQFQITSQNAGLDNAVKRAQLGEMGYQLGNYDNGQFQLSRNPGYVSTKDLQRQQLQNKNKLDQFKLDRMSGGSQFGAVDTSKLKPTKYDEYGLPTAYSPVDELTAGQKLQKDKATSELFDVMKVNEAKQKMIVDAKDSLNKVPTGRVGQMKMMWMKNFDAGNPTLGDWQNIKMLGTDAQLLNTAKTKGAISDREMALFAQAAANDDVYAIPRLLPVIKKLELFMQADEDAKLGAFQKNYGEDARSWFGKQAGQVTGDGGVDPLEAEAKKAIEAGADPKVVMARLAQMRGE